MGAHHKGTKSTKKKESLVNDASYATGTLDNAEDNAGVFHPVILSGAKNLLRVFGGSE